MKKMTLFSLLAAVGLIAAACAPQPLASQPAAVVESLANQPEPSMAPGSSEPVPSQSATSQAPAEEKTAGRYVEYSKAAYDEAAGMRRVLFFYASWCPTCRTADPDIRANEGRLPADLVVLRVNYNDPQTDDEEKTLAKTYAISYQHTFVQVDGQGNALARWNGGGFEELLAKVK
jgi:thiol-disulfide isomerase/thioredoxin